jgi:hypothetical protein
MLQQAFGVIPSISAAIANSPKLINSLGLDRSQN